MLAPAVLVVGLLATAYLALYRIPRDLLRSVDRESTRAGDVLFGLHTVGVVATTLVLSSLVFGAYTEMRDEYLGSLEDEEENDGDDCGGGETCSDCGEPVPAVTGFSVSPAFLVTAPGEDEPYQNVYTLHANGQTMASPN